MSRPTVIAGNWKMYKTVNETVAFIEGFPQEAGAGKEVLLAVPFTAIGQAVEKASAKGIQIGAQNMHDATEGAFTGEIAAKMLKDVGASFVLIGHSERRHVFGESDPFIRAKVERALADQLAPLVCVGETLEQRQGGQTEEVVLGQLESALGGLEKIEGLRVAYEPVWAIGTGETATPEQAQEVHGKIRQWLSDKGLGETPILYGGSVKPANVGELLAQPDVDGVLVGGASLDVESFAAIARGKELQNVQET